MVDYDIKIHIGQQVENFLNGFAAGDKAILERSISNIQDLFERTDNINFKKILKNMDNTRDAEIQKIWNKAQDALKLLVTTKNGDDLFIDIEEIKQDTVNAFNNLETKYWEGIRGLLLKNIQGEYKIQGEDD